ncbi:MAG TPA: hypothetical protein VIC56_10660, partial [Gemmatimonadota bacterium]
MTDPSAESSAPRRRRWPAPGRGQLFLAGCVAVTLLKLWLVGTDEIVARDQPHDDGWFLASASHWYWGAPPESALLRPPAYPLWVAGVRLAGAPLRIAIELALVGSAALLGFALLRAGALAPLCVLLVALVAFDPVSLLVNDYALADTLYAPLLLLLVGCTVLALLGAERGRGAGFGVLTGVVLTALWYTRQETPLLILGLLVLAVLVVRRRDRARTRSRLDVAVLVPAAVLVAGLLTVRTVNAVRFGVFADSELSAPGLTGAYKALVGIVPAVPQRFIPVPREVQERAYEVSPAFRTLRPHLEGPLGRGWQRHTARILGIRDETAAGWMIFALREAAIVAGHREPRRREAFFRKIRSEIGQACEDGRLTCRRVLSHVLDPVPANYVKHLPASLTRVLRWFAAPASAIRPAGGDAPVTPEVRELFDRMASRRTALVAAGQEWVHVSGWAAHAGDPIAQVVARDPGTGAVVAATSEFLPRPGVRDRLGGDTPLRSGFRISAPIRSRTQRPTLHFLTRAGREFSVPYERRLEMDGPFVKGGGAPESLRYAVDSVEEVLTWRTSTDKAKTALARLHGPFVLLLTAAAVVALLLLALGPGEAGTLLPIAGFVVAIVL